MNIETFRNHCLSLLASEEKMPFGNSKSTYDRDLLVFSVLEKWFCFVNIEIFDYCVVKCNPQRSLELQQQYAGIEPGYHMNKKHWISIHFNKDIPDDLILELVRESYLAVRKTLKKLED